MAHTDPVLVNQGEAVSRAGLVHRLARPTGAGPHPTVVMLHGRSGDENVMWVFQRTIPANWLIVAPRGIKPDPDGGFSWHPRKPDEWPSLARFDGAVEAVATFIAALPELYGADPDRVYLMGFSQGAALAYSVAMRRIGLVQGVAGLVGFVPEQGADAGTTAGLRNLPVFVAVGRQDPLIPAEQSQACARILRAAGANLDYHEYDTGHKLNAQGMRDLKAWWQQVGEQ